MGCEQLAPGTPVTILESRPAPDGGTRGRITIDGTSHSPYGWVTSLSKSGQENVALALYEASAAR